ncbi:MAG: hypothetical protein Sapg2KO_47420 [Saprospiraceae bacterium]
MQAAVNTTNNLGVDEQASMQAGQELAAAMKAKADFKADKKSMTRKERKATRKEVKKNLKESISNFEEASDVDLTLLVIVTILIPPVGMLLHEGDITNRFWISLLLTLLFYIPGLIYTLVVILGEN